MDVIDQLERRIDAMLSEMDALRDENARLKERAAGHLTELEEDNRRLRDELDQERATRDAVLDRIDALLSKLKTDTGE